MHQITRSRMYVDWVVFDGALGTCVCRRCGATANLHCSPLMPASPTAINAFIQFHSQCHLQENEDPSCPNLKPQKSTT